MRNVVKFGRDFYRGVMDLDRSKAGLSSLEVVESLNRSVALFMSSIGSSAQVTVTMTKTREFIGFDFHTQLCIVDVSSDTGTTLYFDETLLSAMGEYTGLVFVAKIWVLLTVIDACLKHHPDMTGRFVFEVGDNPWLNQVSFSSRFVDACVILDYEFAESNAYSDYRRFCVENLVPWEKRSPIVFWRGSTTGERTRDPRQGNGSDRLDWLPRLSLCNLAKQKEIAEFCDIGISHIVQISETDLINKIASSDIMRARVPRSEFMNHRVVIDIDGNANSWSGLFQSLLGGSCVAKIASPRGYYQWYYPRLKPWVHYVPVKSDFSDFSGIVRWILLHEDTVRLIGEAGRDLAMAITFEDALRSSALNLINWLLVPRPIQWGVSH